MAIINGTVNNDTLTVQTDTTSVQAGAGTDTVVFSGNYADYTFSQSDSYVSLMTNNTTGQVVSLYGVERLGFDDGVLNLSINGSGDSVFYSVGTTLDGYGDILAIAALNDGGYVVTWASGSSGYSTQRYDSEGSALGDSVFYSVGTTLDGYGDLLAIAALNDGGYVVTWASGSSGYSTQRYDSEGNALGTGVLNANPTLNTVIPTLLPMRISLIVTIPLLTLMI